MNASADARVDLLAGLLALARDVSQARSEDLAAYAIVNQTFQLLPYHVALLWRPADIGTGRVTHASGLARIEADSPFVVTSSTASVSPLIRVPLPRGVFDIGGSAVLARGGDGSSTRSHALETTARWNAIDQRVAGLS